MALANLYRKGSKILFNIALENVFFQYTNATIDLSIGYNSTQYIESSIFTVITNS